MEIEYSADFRKQYLKANVRIQNKMNVCLRIFKNNPDDLQLNNHSLKRNYLGFRSINITSDWRAIYIEKTEGANKVAYFVALGTHDMLYSNKSRIN